MTAQTVSKQLEKARAYENEHKIDASEKPAFHYAAPVGWINDPNGFSWFDNEAHLFAQYHPYSSEWGPMHWAHQTTKDFIVWNLKPCALAPDQPYDDKGCFSGSAIEDDGKHVLMYTGVSMSEEGERQQQCIAIGDGIEYEKLECNPVVGTNLLPDGCSKVDFRDPKLWKENGKYYVVTGSRADDGCGQILVFESENLTDWKLETIMAKSEKRLGYMWECPDFFYLEDKPILILSPQDMRAKGYSWHNGHNTAWITGEMKDHTFENWSAKPLDFGLDFYAPQTMAAPDGRRILIAWMASWDNPLMKNNKWASQMTLPRELTIENGMMMQRPVRELEAYKVPVLHVGSQTISGKFTHEDLKGRCSELDLHIEEGDYETMTIVLAKDPEQGYETRLVIDNRKKLIEFDRTWAGIHNDFNTIRRAPMHEQGVKDLRILLDRHSIEVFVNDGEMVMTNAIMTPAEADQIELIVDGSATMDIDLFAIDTNRQHSC